MYITWQSEICHIKGVFCATLSCNEKLKYIIQIKKTEVQTNKRTFAEFKTYHFTVNTVV